MMDKSVISSTTIDLASVELFPILSNSSLSGEARGNKFCSTMSLHFHYTATAENHNIQYVTIEDRSLSSAPALAAIWEEVP